MPAVTLYLMSRFNLLDQKDYRAPEPIAKNERIHNRGIARIDLALVGVDLGNDLQFTFEYCTALFKPETM